MFQDMVNKVIDEISKGPVYAVYCYHGLYNMKVYTVLFFDRFSADKALEYARKKTEEKGKKDVLYWHIEFLFLADRHIEDELDRVIDTEK